MAMYERIFSLLPPMLIVAGLAGGFLVASPDRALEIRGAVQTDDDVAQRLRELRDEDPLVRRHAAWALGELEDARGVEALHGRLRDSNADVRLVAAWALGEIKEDGSIEPLIALLGDADPFVREMAVLSLGEIESTSAVSAVVEAAERHSELREPAVWALGEIGGRQAEEARDALIEELELAERENEEVWTGRLGSREARSMSGDVTALVAALADGDPVVRRSAAEWLGKSGDPRAVEPLLDALRDGEPSVRAMAVWSLDEINPSRPAKEQGHDNEGDRGQDHDSEPGIRV